MEDGSSEDLSVLNSSIGEDLRDFDGVVYVRDIACLLTPLTLMLLGSKHE